MMEQTLQSGDTILGRVRHTTEGEETSTKSGVPTSEHIHVGAVQIQITEKVGEESNPTEREEQNETGEHEPETEAVERRDGSYRMTAEEWQTISEALKTQIIKMHGYRESVIGDDGQIASKFFRGTRLDDTSEPDNLNLWATGHYGYGGYWPIDEPIAASRNDETARIFGECTEYWDVEDVNRGEIPSDSDIIATGYNNVLSSDGVSQLMGVEWMRTCKPLHPKFRGLAPPALQRWHISKATQLGCFIVDEWSAYAIIYVDTGDPIGNQGIQLHVPASGEVLQARSQEGNYGQPQNNETWQSNLEEEANSKEKEANSLAPALMLHLGLDPHQYQIMLIMCAADGVLPLSPFFIDEGHTRYRMHLDMYCGRTGRFNQEQEKERVTRLAAESDMRAVQTSLRELESRWITRMLEQGRWNQVVPVDDHKMHLVKSIREDGAWRMREHSDILGKECFATRYVSSELYGQSVKLQRQPNVNFQDRGAESRRRPGNYKEALCEKKMREYETRGLSSDSERRYTGEQSPSLHQVVFEMSAERLLLRIPSHLHASREQLQRISAARMIVQRYQAAQAMYSQDAPKIDKFSLVNGWRTLGEDTRDDSKEGGDSDGGKGEGQRAKVNPVVYLANCLHVPWELWDRRHEAQIMRRHVSEAWEIAKKITRRRDLSPSVMEQFLHMLRSESEEARLLQGDAIEGRTLEEGGNFSDDEEPMQVILTQQLPSIRSQVRNTDFAREPVEGEVEILTEGALLLPSPRAPRSGVTEDPDGGEPLQAISVPVMLAEYTFGRARRPFVLDSPSLAGDPKGKGIG